MARKLYLTTAVKSVSLYSSLRVLRLFVCVYTTFGQGGAAQSWRLLAPTDLPACGFEHQITGSEATE